MSTCILCQTDEPRNCVKAWMLEEVAKDDSYDSLDLAVEASYHFQLFADNEFTLLPWIVDMAWEVHPDPSE